MRHKPKKAEISGRKAASQSATTPARRPESFPVAGIGASAGGLEAFTSLLAALPANPGLALVFVQHLDPKHKSLLPEILSRPARMPVMEAQDGMRVHPDHIYVIPPNADLTIARGAFRVLARSTTRGQHMPVDVFLRSLAVDQKNKAIGVILSGTASDGALGLTAIKAEGGIAFAQDEQSAKYNGMPRSAVQAGVVDLVLPPDAIARELERIGRHPYLISPKAEASVALLRDSRNGLGEIFNLLRQAFDTDFTDYKDTTIRRRIKRRMVLHKMEEPQAYIQFLKKHRDELEALYHDILINVTSFLRDPGAFDALKATVFPAIKKNHRQDAPFRIWVPGCATGEEVYSIALCLLEFLDSKGVAAPIQIFGTDVSQSAIDKARTGIYLENIALDVSAERLRRFFVHLEGGGYQITKSVRDLCVLAQHDLIKDAPFSRLDLVSCRNLLIYLGPALQKKVLSMFHYALQPHGFLMLGSSETVGSSTQRFRLVDKRSKIYAKKELAIRPRLEFPLVHEALGRMIGGTGKPGGHAKPEFDTLKEADRIVQARFAPPGVLLNEDMEVLQFRGHTSDFLEPAPGTASFNVMKLAREGLLPDLHGAIQEARKGPSPARRKGIRINTGDRVKVIDLSVHAIRAPQRAEQAFLVLFEEPTALSAKASGMRSSARRSPAKAGTVRGRSGNGELQRELAVTRDYLKSIVEEKEAANEELKTANEEILSSNEELQSTNEELETAKEELQSGNEELTTLNEELQNRNLELNQVNNDLLNLFVSIDIPVVMLGSDLRIRRFTPQAEKVLNLIPGDLGRPFTDIRLNLDLPNVHELIFETIDSASPQHLEIQDKEGRWYSLWIRPYKTSDNKIEGAVLALVDIQPFKAQTAELSAAKEDLEAEIVDHKRSLEELRRFKFISDHASDGHDLIDRDGRLLYVNQRASERLGYTEAEMLKLSLWDIDPLMSKERVGELFQQLEKEEVGPFESMRLRKDGTTFPVEVGVIGLRIDGAASLFMVARDITDRKKADQRFHLAVEAAPNAMVMVNEDGKVLFVNAQMERLFGYSRDELLGMSVDELVPKRLRTKHAGFRGEFLSSPQARPMGGGRDLYALRKDGSEFPVEIGLNPIETEDGVWVLGAIVDISERKRVEAALQKAHDELEVRVQARTAQLREAVEQLNLQMSERWRAEEALRTSERRYRDLFENANDLLFTLDFEGNFTSLNQTAEQALGYPREAASHLNLLRITLPGEHGVTGQILKQEGGDGGKELNLSVRAKDGHSIPLEIRSRWIRENGRPVGVQCIARDITERKKAEQERREVSARLTRLQDDERRRLARELHDSTGQNLAALKMSLGAVQDSPTRLDPRARKALSESQELAELCIREVRTLSYLLHPPLLDERGLAFALKLYAEGYSERSGVAVEIEIPAHFGRIPQELEIACFRVAQECLTNIHRHSGSSTARIRLEKTDSEIRLEVSDAGRGFSAGTIHEREGHGLGIQAMRERARQLGGHLEIDSSPSGTQVLAVLPLPPGDP